MTQYSHNEKLEELTEQLKMVLERETKTQVRHDKKVDDLEDKLAECEARLSKAVNVIKHLINIAPEGEEDEWHIALDDAAEALAEIKGETT